MDPKNSEISANYIYSNLPDNALRLKSLFKEIEADYDNPSYDYILRQCKSVKDLEKFLRDYSHLFMVENKKVARYYEKLEIGQGAADRYFEEKLKEYNSPVTVENMKKLLVVASRETLYFIKTFYAETEFKRYFARRPHLFYISDGNTVCLIEKECVEFFRKIVKQGEGIRFMSLRGNVGQAPEHIRIYINNQYPDTEFRNFIDSNNDVFLFRSNGRVFLVK